MIIDRWTARLAGHRWSIRALDTVSRWHHAAEAWLASSPRYRAVCLVVLAAQTALIWTHVPWRDEWQALQIAVETPTLPALFEALRFEGHPAVWYLLLRGLAAVFGDPYALAAAATLCALPAQAGVLARAPFDRTVRVLLACSVFFLFEFYTVSRSLSLGVALFVGALLAWRSGWRWLFIALLPQCDFVFGLLSIALIVLAWRERRPPLAGLAVWLASSVAAAITVIPHPAFTPDSPAPALPVALGQFMNGLGIVLLPLQWEFGPVWNATLPLLLVPVGWLGAILFLRAQTRADRLQGWTMLGFVAALGLLSVFVYPLANRHVMLVAVLLVGMIWLRALGGRQPGGPFVAWLGTSAVIGIFVATYSAFVPFDTAPRFASEIERRGLAAHHWATLSAPHGQPVTALTGMRFERLEKQCMQTFVRWDHRPTLTTRRKLASYLKDLGDRRGSFYLLSPYKLAKFPPDIAKLRFKVAPGYDGQHYFAYEVAPGRPRFTGALPPCVRGLRSLPRARSLGKK